MGELFPTETLGPKEGRRSKNSKVTDDIVPSVGKPCRMASDAKGLLGYLASLSKSQKPCEVRVPRVWLRVLLSPLRRQHAAAEVSYF